jgi:hypothetical protein
MARDGERCRMAVIRAVLLGFDERAGGRAIRLKLEGPAEGRKRAVLVCIALQLHTCGPAGHAG